MRLAAHDRRSRVPYFGTEKPTARRTTPGNWSPAVVASCWLFALLDLLDRADDNASSA